MATREKRPRKRPLRRKHIELGEINVVAHPHSQQIYRGTFYRLANSDVAALYHGQRFVEIGTGTDLNDSRLPGAIAGRIFVYSRINFDAPWLNAARNEEASPDELRRISIPSGLHPEFRQFRYIFSPSRHRLYFERYNVQRKTLSPRAFVKALNEMLFDPRVRQELSELSAYVVPSTDALASILSMSRLRKLQIVLNKPNPDDEEFETEILKAMEEQNISTIEQTLQKAPGKDAINPNENTTMMARLASRVGIVVGWGRNALNAPIERSTEEEPISHSISYKDTEDSLDHMIEYIYNIQPDD